MHSLGANECVVSDLINPFPSHFYNRLTNYLTAMCCEITNCSSARVANCLQNLLQYIVEGLVHALSLYRE